MKANEILNKIKNIVGEKVNLSEEKIEMAEITLENGTVLVAESFEAGKSIFIKTDDEQIALPVGEYKLEGDKILVVSEEGLIDSIKEAAEEENFIQGGIAGSKEFNNTFLPESQIKKLDVGDDDEPVQAQPMLNQQAQATPATGQVNANRFAALFPNDPLGTAIAQKGTQRG